MHRHVRRAFVSHSKRGRGARSRTVARRIFAGRRVVYYDTTQADGAERDDAALHADKQDDLVLWFFQKVQEASPSVVHAELVAANWIAGFTPLTSIRRAITSLTNKGLLVKTGRKVIGAYGRHEYVWEVAPPMEPKQLGLFK